MGDKGRPRRQEETRGDQGDKGIPRRYGETWETRGEQGDKGRQWRQWRPGKSNCLLWLKTSFKLILRVKFTLCSSRIQD